MPRKENCASSFLNKIYWTILLSSFYCSSVLVKHCLIDLLIDGSQVILSISVYLYELFSVFMSQTTKYFMLFLYRSLLIFYILRFIIFIPLSWRYFWWKKAYNSYLLDSSILSWFDSFVVLSIPLASCVSFLLLLNFFYPLYIHTRLTLLSPSVAKRRWRHALQHNPHPPT